MGVSARCDGFQKTGLPYDPQKSEINLPCETESSPISYCYKQKRRYERREKQLESEIAETANLKDRYEKAIDQIEEIMSRLRPHLTDRVEERLQLKRSIAEERVVHFKEKLESLKNDRNKCKIFISMLNELILIPNLPQLTTIEFDRRLFEMPYPFNN